MKYLIQNRKEFAITVGFFIMMAYDLYSKLKQGDIDANLIATFVFYALGLMGWFYNMPTSDMNNEFTPIMRYAKEQAKKGDISMLDMVNHAIEEWECEENDD